MFPEPRLSDIVPLAPGTYKAYISLDKPAVRDANETMMKNNRNAKSGKREMNGGY